MKQSGDEVVQSSGRSARRWLKPVVGLRKRWRLMLGVIVAALFAVFILGLWWSEPPGLYNVAEHAQEQAIALDLVQANDVPGIAVVVTLINNTSTLLDKPGGFIRNDRMPPGVWLDNMPNWELGVLWHIRDTLHVLRQDISRTNPQAEEDANLVMAEPQLNFTSTRWLMPSSESEYRQGLAHLERYLTALTAGEAAFYVRLEDMNTLLEQADDRLRGLNQALLRSASARLDNLDQPPLVQLQSAPQEAVEPPPRLATDDVFYQTRGYSWALMHALQAMALDYDDVLPSEALGYLDGAIRELAALQRPVWSPMVLNSDGFGLLTNHSLVAAGHVGRAHQQLADLKLTIAAE